MSFSIIGFVKDANPRNDNPIHDTLPLVGDREHKNNRYHGNHWLKNYNHLKVANGGRKIETRFCL